MSLLQSIEHVAAGKDLSEAEMTAVMEAIMHGEWTDDQIASLLIGLHEKGETIHEVTGAAQALRQNMRRIHSSHQRLLDTCGTGGDHSGTFNISTAAAIVIAATGVPVAKHGNRSATSRTGSADVLAELGVNIQATVEQAERCLEEAGICFCFAPLLHPSMKHVAAVRRQLGIRTIFNLLGPLCNPADAAFQLLGVGQPPVRNLIAEALQQLGTQRSVVVCGEDGLDEVTLCGPTHCSVAEPSGCREFDWEPSDFGITPVTDRTSLLVESPHESAVMIREVLNNAPGPPREIVILNAAAALWTVGFSPQLPRCAEAARESLQSGAAAKTLHRLTKISHR